MLRRLHALPRPESFELPEQELLERVEPRIESAPIDSDDKDFLLGHLDRLSAEIAYPAARLVRGDAGRTAIEGV
ncbi:hypothetical protein ACQPZF_40295 [Actinosynnema sp. CS-041913]|uniref:hypothetical protein n=1 Tax=Actinosynnema sp. CS-041913 TaxID=3239917 RepID=UPI003D94E735